MGPEVATKIKTLTLHNFFGATKVWKHLIQRPVHIDDVMSQTQLRETNNS